ncbi:hypothetical protein AVEN_117329-1 [Araneus ventricosus]|uniref:RNase H type-1 domain-containing protein n=1 Tax=Araneus ventricosus TaxID=182803 RepID=A0A4Y2JH46_ARAVE|nr:hypothetical protein AVEN_117329-1 [Araneus ventricosus]
MKSHKESKVHPIERQLKSRKINNQTGSAYCAISNEVVIKTWKVKLSPANTVFQAEILALKAAIKWVITANEKVNIWSDSEYSLQALKTLYVKSKKELGTNELSRKCQNQARLG